MSRVVNLRDAELEPARHARDGHRYANRSLGAELGATLASWGLYELGPGQAAGAYHYELNREEWLLVVSGEVTLRTPAGERVLRAGDIVCFPLGPDGAHSMRNDGAEPARFAMPSTVPRAAWSIVYPDSERVAVVGPGFKRMMRIGEDLSYWEGES
jgi:uncharacterized cupin superfamily protein